MKVIYVLPVLPAFGFGGTERFLANLILAHSNQYQTVLLTFRPMGRYFEHLPCRRLWLEDCGVSEQDILEIGSRRNVLLAVRVAWRIHSLVRRESPDVVVGVLHIAAFLLAIARDVFRMKTPFIANIHGDSSAYLLHEVPSRLSRIIIKTFIWYFCKCAAAVIVPSQGVRSDLINNFHVSANKIHAIYNGMDIKFIQLQSKGPLDNTSQDDSLPMILGVGRLDTQKSFHILIAAFTAVVKHVPARLVILGEGSERPSLEKLIISLGIQKSVSLPGFVDNPYRWMAGASVFCLSSAHEGFGLVLVEAMACSCPVVSTDCLSGPGEIIRNGENGLLVPVGDSAAMADAIMRILTNERLRSGLVEAGLKRSHDFTIPEMVTRYEAVYQGIMSA